MSAEMKLSERSRLLLRCPICRAGLLAGETAFACTNIACAGQFPIVDGIPVLINEANSVFALADFTERRSTTFRPVSRVARLVSALLPQLGSNTTARANYRAFADLLATREHAHVLVIGGSIVGHGMEDLLARPNIEFVETDVALGPRTQAICDAHDLPFADRSFDGVIAQAVLEHVADPQRCVEEIHRVLKPQGFVYAETPFMQQVHQGGYDFTRFTHLGHRRLFRRFDELASGPTAGQGTALAWACRYFLLGFVRTRAGVLAIKALTQLTLFWLKYLDRFLMNRPGVFDGASGYYFLGSTSDSILSDRAVVRGYRGIL